MYSYRTKGVCARAINFDVRDGLVHDVQFMGGCDGNTNALSKLLEGMPAQQVIDLLEGNDCAGRGTSCADQLTKGLRLALEREAANA